MISRILFAAIFSLLLFSCSDDPIVVEPEKIVTEEVKEGNIDLSNLQVGQKSFFKAYSYQCGVDQELSFQNDLVLECIGEAGNLSFKEYFITNEGPSEPIIYKVEINGSELVIEDRERSSLFYFYGSDVINTKPEVLTDLSQDECMIELNGEDFVGNEVGFVTDFQVDNMLKSNKAVVSCVPTFLALDAYIIYDNKQIMGVHTVSSSEFMGEITTYASGFHLEN